MDGFGWREEKKDNAIAAANTPTINRLLADCPHTLIECSGPAVGLPEGQMGNSEVGHLNLGAGRVVYQDVTRIDRAIESGEFYQNGVFASAMERVALEKRALHLFGLVSDGKVHSSLDHLYALVEMASRKGVKEVYLHAFMDGRDTLPQSGAGYMKEVLAKFDEIGLGKVATIGGRYYGMDRDRRWERTQQAYSLIVGGQNGSAKDPLEVIKASYAEGITDEFIKPVKIDNGDPEKGRLQERDAVIMFNFRADRMRQLAHLLCGHEIEGFSYPDNPGIELVTMTNFEKKLYEAKVAFHPVHLNNILGEILAAEGLKQLRTAETEKYAHVTFFFNGGVEKPFENEDRDMVASPKVATYDLQPEMSSVEVTDNVVRRINSRDYSFVLINYANCDMVGHTGIFDAAKAAVEAVDTGLGRVLAAVEKQKGVALITADHGNAELMVDPDRGGPWTAHTTNPVPLILFDPSGQLSSSEKVSLRDGGILADVAPTVLEIMGIERPREMTGKSLLVKG